MATKKEEGKIVITEIREGVIEVVLYGRRPLIINRLPEKARRELLAPAGRKNEAAKAAALKHDPLSEFRASIHRIADATAPTLLGVPAAAPKCAMATAALDIPGAKKAQIGRLVYIPGNLIGIYGKPQVFTMPVRNSDINHTPDIRTRCIVAEWCAQFEIHYQEPMLTATAVLNLLHAAGRWVGLGDYRPEKGKGSYGQFDVLSVPQAQEDEAVQACMRIGREAQEQAMLVPQYYDDETTELLNWFDLEIATRGRTVKKTAKEEAAV